MSGRVIGRVTFWLKVLQRGAIPLNSAAGWVGTAVILLGIAGIVVPLAFDLPPLIIAVVLVSLLVLVVGEGGYRLWRDTDKERNDAIDQRDAARGEIAGLAVADQRMAQAKRVQVWRTGPQKKAFDFGPDHKFVTIHVKNDSKDLIYDLVFSWLKGAAPWGPREDLPQVLPGREVTKSRELPGDLPTSVDTDVFSAVVHVVPTSAQRGLCRPADYADPRLNGPAGGR